MAKELVIQKNRTNVVTVSLGIDVSDDTITSEIRTHENSTSDLIATWQVAFLTDGTDGELVLTLDNSIVDDIPYKSGYMDIKRVTNGEPVSVFDNPLLVIFRETITV